MQIGSLLHGLYAGKKLNDPQMALFYRDLTRSPGVIGIYGRGQRSYSGDVRNQEQSDLLYQAISDLWLRVAELTCDEDLMLHPAVYGRYSDAVDVTADLQHRDLDPNRKRSWWRANFFRTQTHDHRWEAWDASPYMSMLRNPQDAAPPGLTDAIHFVNHRAGGRVNWSELMNFFHPLAMLKVVRDGYQPPKLPPLPQDVKVTAADNGVKVTWKPLADQIAGYRVYRADSPGAPLTLLNSPYRSQDGQLVKDALYADPNGTVNHFYFVTALDAQGRESRWFPDEPTPLPGKKPSDTRAATKQAANP